MFSVTDLAVDCVACYGASGSLGLFQNLYKPFYLILSCFAQLSLCEL